MMISTTIKKTVEEEGVWVPVLIRIVGHDGKLPQLEGKIIVSGKGADSEGNLHELEKPVDEVLIQDIALDHPTRSGGCFGSFMQDFCGLAEDLRENKLKLKPTEGETDE